MSNSLLSVYKSRRVVLPNGVVRPASVIVSVNDGKIISIEDYYGELNNRFQPVTVEDFGDLVISPGIVDSHVHVNEPGRTHWEGFTTATRAAAAGGVTCIVDMPLNSIPPTTTLSNFSVKRDAAGKQVAVDLAFWGGIIPGNQDELIPLLAAGIRGFKCFMCPSGVDEFPHVTEEDLETVYQKLQNSKTTILFHAEVEAGTENQHPLNAFEDQDPQSFSTFLNTRPESMELEAIRQVIQLARRYRVPSHIVHLSSARALPLIAKAKKDGVPITVETCPHYLTLSSQEVPSGNTQFKCCPPIRDKGNQDDLWKGVLDGVIDLIVSDHSPCPKDMKCFDTGDFLKAWGGISSLQLALPLVWTNGQPKGLTIQDLARLMSENPAKLAQLDDRKGSIAVGMDADFCIWDPDANISVSEDVLLFRHKTSPYIGQSLQGRVNKTVLRGQVVYSDGVVGSEPHGILITTPLY